MDTPLLIRKASTTDIPVIRQIAHQTWPVAYGTILSTEQISYMLELMYSVASLEEQMQQQHQFYLVEHNQMAIGFASVSKESPTVCKLNKLYVLPATQKTGAGKALLQQAIAHAKELNVTILQLTVNRHNPARNFYQKQGFLVTNEIINEIGNGYVMDDYVMELNLL